MADGIGEITLNRPKALNALNLGMIRRLLQLYADWSRPGSGVRCIVVKGAGGKSFCAGGDVKSNVLSARSGDVIAALEFFRQEYSMNAVIGRLATPHVAMLDGIVMGGGAGVSMHGQFRVATERTLFAMPETAIGLFPDVGMMQLLAALPGEVGPYLALTGARLRGHEVKEVGLATHYLPSSSLGDLTHRLRNLGPRASDPSAVASELAAAEAAAAPPPPPGGAARRLALIGSLFGGSGGGGGAGAGGRSISDVFDAVRRARVGADDEAWLQETRQQLERASPLSAAVTWEYMKRARASKMGLAACLEQDWALVGHFVAGEADYWEGVRARLIDKDEKPAWRYCRVEDVSAADVEALLRLAPGQRRLGLGGGAGPEGGTGAAGGGGGRAGGGGSRL